MFLLIPAFVYSSSLESIFKNGTSVGNVTFFHYLIDKDHNLNDAYANAVGGDLKYTTDNSKKIFASVGFHASTPVLKRKNQDKTSLFNKDKNSTALTAISESFLAYKTGRGILKVGNFFLNTPLLNQSSSRIVPWSYQGANYLVKDVFKSSIQLSYINKIRSYVSDKYKKETYKDGKFDNGIAMIGIKHHPLELVDVHMYYYSAPSLYDASFFQIDYRNNKISDHFLYCFGFQHFKTYENNDLKKDVDLIGLRTGIFTEYLDMTLNYTKNTGESGADGYGGLSKIYTLSMIATGRGSNEAEALMLKADMFYEIIDKHNTEFSVWLTDTKSKTTDYRSYYAHIKHTTNYFAKFHIRYEHIDHQDTKTDEDYFRLIASYDF